MQPANPPGRRRAKVIPSELLKGREKRAGKTALIVEDNAVLRELVVCLLEAHGYQLSVTELVGWEHSMKNELIIARFANAPRGNARERLTQILHELSLDDLKTRFLY